MLLELLFISFLAHTSAEISLGSVYTVGHLTCEGIPYAYQHVQIYEKNYVFADQLWMDTVTDKNGNFSMKAWGMESFPNKVTPYVYIPNFCGTVLSAGRRCSAGAMQINVPDDFIDPTHVPKKKFDIGSIELHHNDTSERLGLGSILWGTFADTVECRDY